MGALSNEDALRFGGFLYRSAAMAAAAWFEQGQALLAIESGRQRGLGASDVNRGLALAGHIMTVTPARLARLRVATAMALRCEFQQVRDVMGVELEHAYHIALHHRAGALSVWEAQDLYSFIGERYGSPLAVRKRDINTVEGVKTLLRAIRNR